MKLDPLLECEDCGQPNDPGSEICVECLGENLYPLPNSEERWKTIAKNSLARSFIELSKAIKKGPT